MSIQEARETRRWWIQNEYKYKNEGMPDYVAKAFSVLGEAVPAQANQMVKELNAVPQTSVSAGVAEWVKEVEIQAREEAKQAEPKTAESDQDEFTLELHALSEERKNASHERRNEIDRRKQRIYYIRYTRNNPDLFRARNERRKAKLRKKPASSIPQKPTEPVSNSRPSNVQAVSAHTENPQNIPATPAMVAPPVSDLQKMLSLFAEVSAELERAEAKHPNWPSNLIKQAAIVGEESGELLKAALQHDDEGGTLEAIREEAIQTCAMCLRLLKNLPQ